MKKTIICLLIICACVFAASAQTSNRYSGSYAKGVQLFYAGDYAGAITEFEKAEADNPANHAAYLWHGLAYAALGDLDGKASNIWLKMPYDEKWKSTYRYFMGLGYWKAGETGNAKYWLNEAIKHPEVPASKLAQTALKSLLDDGEAPPIEVWATLASLPGAKSAKDFAKEDEDSSEITNENQSDSEQTETSGAKPSGGLWRATISNGYKGQTLSFRVSSNGTTISDVAFQGYLICSGSRTENTQLAPLRNISISGGSFEDTQLNSGAKVKFIFNGTFSGATTASGTYRAIADGCDTYKLNWTASRFGN